MNYRELIRQLTPQTGAGEARAIVRWVMEERFGLSQTDLLLGKDTTLSADDRTEFEKIASRLLNGEPVQYILGFADFCGHHFRVTPDVLIPRPETEDLVHEATTIIHQKNSDNTFKDCPNSLPHPSPSSRIQILDLCTGSGCIATSLALDLPEAHVVGVDVSESALEVARNNATSLGATNIEFFQQDILIINTPIPRPHGGSWRVASQYFNSQYFNFLTANPPYVRSRESAEMSPTVLDHEPHLALFVPDDDPLLFYRAIARIAKRTLLPHGHFLLEINTALHEETRQLFAAAGFHKLQIINDRYGRPRILHGVA
jgi:release factor glutamine methyltransferase